MNPMFNMFGNTPFSNFANMMNQYNQFKSTFSGDPQAKVQELLKSGQMTQSQFDQLSQMAQLFRQLMGR